MPKNVVGRLLHLENEMKSVISICDISNNELKSSKLAQKRGKPPARSSSSNADYTRRSPVRAADEPASRMTEKPVERQLQETKVTGYQRKKTLIEKPNSAPPGALSTINEAENYPQRKRSVQHAPKKADGISAVDSLEWFDCSPQTCEAHEQTLRPPEEILIDISQYGNENFLPKRSTTWCRACRRKALECVCPGKHHWETYYHPTESNDKQQEDINDADRRESFLQQIKPDLKESMVINELARQIGKKEMEAMSTIRDDQRKCARITMLQQNELETGSQTTEDKRQLREFHDGSDMLETGNRQDHRCNGRPVTAPAKSRTNETHSPVRFERQGTMKMSLHVEDDSDGNSAVVENSDDVQENKLSDCQTDYFRLNGNDLIDDENYVQWMRDAIDEQQESASDAESSAKISEDLKDLKHKKNLSEATTRKIAEIIELNHEKIEKMRRSRLLALNTVKCLKEKYDALAEMKKNMAQKLEILIVNNEHLMKELQEADKLKQRMFQEWEKYKQENSPQDLADRLRFVNEENTQYREKIQYLEQQLQERMRWEEERAKTIALTEKTSEASQLNQDKCYQYHLLFRRQEAAYRRLVQGIAVLEKVIRNNKEKEKRLSDIKAELKRRAAKTQCYLDRLTAEKMDLYHVVNELRAYVEERQLRIDQLEDEARTKDEELENQKKIVAEKSETLEDTNRELESIRRNSADLEEQVKTLRKSIETFDQMHQNLLKERQGFEELVQRIKDENTKLQEQISNEKDSILIKNKIIEDQQETIKQLREKSEEMKAMTQKIQSLERLIDVERGEKLELQETVERLKWKKDELKQKVKSLEADLLLAPQEVVRDLQKTQSFLHELENQVHMKQKEWEVLVQSLEREKEQACSVAAFATKKLIQTTSDFQRQSDEYKKLYKILTVNLIEKKKHLQDATEKAKQNVRFSEDLHQESSDGFDVQLMRNTERFRCQAKQMGILKRSKEWFDGSPENSNGCRDMSEKTVKEELKIEYAQLYSI